MVQAGDSDSSEIKEQGKKKETKLNPKQLYAITQTDLSRFINAERERGTGADQLLLYFFYEMQGNIQKTNQPKAVNKFVKGEKDKSGLGRGNEKINKIRKELENPVGTYKPLISPVKQKNSKGQISGHYIKINHPIKADYQKTPMVTETFLDNTKDLVKSMNQKTERQDKIQDLLKELERNFGLTFEYIDKTINSGKGGKHYTNNGGMNYKPLSLRTIFNVCCFISVISSLLRITPEYNKNTIRGLHRCLVEIRFYQILWSNTDTFQNLLKYFIEFLEMNGRDTKNIVTFTDLMIQDGVKLSDKIRAFSTLDDIEEGTSPTKRYLYRHGNKDYKFVLLSPEQYLDLKRDYGVGKTDRAIQRLNEIIIIEYSKFYQMYWYNKNTGEILIDKTIETTATDEDKKDEIKYDIRKITSRIYGIGYHYIVLNEMLKNDYKKVEIGNTDYFYKENMDYLYEDDNFDYRENPNYNPTDLDTDTY